VATFVPAAYAEVLAVTAMGDANGKPGGKGSWGSNCAFGDRLLEKDDRYASFSNYALPGDPAQVSHTVAAPGVCIYSTAMGGGYTTKSGTSMAAPHAAGTVALCLASACAGLSPADVIAKIRADAATYNNTTSTGYGFTGDPRRPVSGKYYGYLLRAGSY
jgi:subtilisin family serine protease